MSVVQKAVFVDKTSVQAVCAGKFWQGDGSWAGRPGTCGKTLFMLLAPSVQSWSGLWAMWLGKCCSNLAGWPKHPDTVPTQLINVEGDINNSICQNLQSQRVPAVSQPSLFVVFSFVVQSALSYSLGSNCSLHMCIFQRACGRGRIQYPPMFPPSWTSSDIDF